MITTRYTDVYNGQLASLLGSNSFVATTGATTIITVPANRYWDGVISLSSSVANTGAGTSQGQALIVCTVASFPASYPTNGAQLLACNAFAGINVTGGTVGDDGQNSTSIPVVLFAGSGGTLQVQVTVTITGTIGRCDASASGLVF